MNASPAINGKLVRSGNIRQHVFLSGPERGRVVLLVHGLGWDAMRLWGGHIAALAERGWRVLAPNLRGVGQSSPITQPLHISDFAEDLLALLAAENVGECAVVGFSLGGMIALDLAARENTPIRAAALCCCSTHSSGEGDAATLAMLDRAAAIGPRQFAQEQAQLIWHRSWAADHPDRVADFVDWRSSMDQSSLAHAFRSSFGVDLRPRLSAVTVPSLVVCAETDPFASVAAMQAMADALPDASFRLIPKSGHMAPIEQPEAFDAALVEFLQDAWPASRQHQAS